MKIWQCLCLILYLQSIVINIFTNKIITILSYLDFSLNETKLLKKKYQHCRQTLPVIILRLQFEFIYENRCNFLLIKIIINIADNDCLSRYFCYILYKKNMKSYEIFYLYKIEIPSLSVLLHRVRRCISADPSSYAS